MKKLIKLVKSLDQSEVKYIQHFLVITKCTLRLKLFRGIVAEKILSNEDAIRIIYFGKKNAASVLSHLKAKLEVDILNQLLILIPNSDHQKNDAPEIMCEKYLIQSRILFAKGLSAQGLELLDKTLSLANRYDLPHIDLSSCYLLLKKRDETDMADIMQKFEQSTHRYRNLVDTKYRYFSKHLPHRSLDVSTYSEGKRAIYWKSLRSVEKLYEEENYEAAYSKALSLLDFLYSDKYIRSKENESELHQLLSQICLFREDYQEAIHHAKELWRLKDDGFEHLFFAYIRHKHFQQAQELLIKVEGSHNINKEMINKIILFKAAIRFYQKEFRDVLDLLQFWKSKDCHDFFWNLTPRIMELQANFEIGEYDLFEDRLECLRKKIERGNGGKIPERLSLIMLLFHSIIKKSFRLPMLLKEEDAVFAQLCNCQGPTKWDPMSYELINMPKWLLTKCYEFKK